MRMRAGPGKSWPRRAAPRSGCSLVPAQIWMLDCCSHMSFHLWPLRSAARCHDNGPYHFSTARCHGNGPDCTILHAIFRSKCTRDVTEHVGRDCTDWHQLQQKSDSTLSSFISLFSQTSVGRVFVLTSKFPSLLLFWTAWPTFTSLDESKALKGSEFFNTFLAAQLQISPRRQLCFERYCSLHGKILSPSLVLFQTKVHELFKDMHVVTAKEEIFVGEKSRTFP